MSDAISANATRQDLQNQYLAVRRETEHICSSLKTDDYQLQSITETSPPKWHIAHVTWFFEAFVLPHFNPGYKAFHPRFCYLFNSYYETVGSMQPRAKRGMLSRPCVEEVYAYRRYVDEQMLELIENADDTAWQDLYFRVTLGLNHEQQHQELLLMDIKHNFSVNPLRPAYNDKLVADEQPASDMRWVERQGGIVEIGNDAETFCYDNETPRHQVLLQDHRLATRLVNNSEYLEFIQDDGYSRPELWLADGWYLIQKAQWQHPLYWENLDNEWWTFTLGGMRRLDPNEPVSHLSFYEADAYARWTGKRLPTEAELEHQLAEMPVKGRFLDHHILHPRSASEQWYGDLWQWTSSAYAPYPGFKPLEGSMGEYNGKFMSNQMTLRGGACVTPQNHTRASYRNFFYPHDRWQFSGLRLAEDA
jgi:ergothioneine biosynthesis protein EgtB